MIRERLLSMQDIPYREFQRKLIPNIDPETIIGVRTPQLRHLARTLRGTQEAADFMAALPHRFFEENQVHAFLIAQEKDFDVCLAQVNRFLPFVDNWATCDQLSPRALKTDLPRLLSSIRVWLASEHPYTVRFGVNCLMQGYLGDAFDPGRRMVLCHGAGAAVRRGAAVHRARKAGALDAQQGDSEGDRELSGFAGT